MVLLTGTGVNGSVNNFLYASILAAVFVMCRNFRNTSEGSNTKICSSELRGTAYGIYNVVIGVVFS
jgi:hypothetical protein